MKRKYSNDDIISIIEFAKDKNIIESEKIFKLWNMVINNQINETDEKILLSVDIFENPIIINNKEIGKIIIFRQSSYFHEDAKELLISKYFSYDPFYHFQSSDEYLLFFLGDIFKKENILLWDRPTGDENFIVFRYELPNSELIFTCDTSENGFDSEEFRRSLDGYSRYWDMRSHCVCYIKNIDGLKYQKSKSIIEQRIRERKLNELIG
jgi:hypothetical protein